VRSTVLAGARVCLIGFLAASLLNLPAMATGVPSLGMIVSSSDALLSHSLATRGANVYPGDSLLTQSDGSLRLAFGANQLYLRESTQATMLPASGAVRARLDRGAADFSMQPGQFEVQTPLGVIRNGGKSRAFGSVTIVSPTKIQISSYEGSLLVASADGESQNIGPGETFIASLGPGGDPTGPGIQGVGQPRKINWRRVAGAAIIVGGATLGGYFVYNELTESCSKPNCGAK